MRNVFYLFLIKAQEIALTSLIYFLAWKKLGRSINQGYQHEFLMGQLLSFLGSLAEKTA